MRKWLGRIAALALCCAVVGGLCSCEKKKQEILICTSDYDYCIEHMTRMLKEEFPQYNITIDYVSTGNLAAKLAAEGRSADCDIVDALEFGYLAQLDRLGVLCDLSFASKPDYVETFVESAAYLPQEISSGAVVLNTKVLAEKGLQEPGSFKDLLKPEYKGLISMPNPKSSSTGYMFLLALANSWGEDEAFEYFDALAPNVLSFTSSSSGTINAVSQGESAIALGMTVHGVVELNKGRPLKVVYFDEGTPYLLYGRAIIAGKEAKPGVKEVFDYLTNTYNYFLCEKYYPEKIFKDRDFHIENYPSDIRYADMGGNTIERKDHLLDRWKF